MWGCLSSILFCLALLILSNTLDPCTLGTFLLVFSIHFKLMLSSDFCCSTTCPFVVEVHKTWMLMCVLGTGASGKRVFAILAYIAIYAIMMIMTVMTRISWINCHNTRK